MASGEVESLDEDRDEFQVGSLERGKELEGGVGGGDGRVVGDGEVAGVTDEVVDHVRGKRGEIVGIDASTEERLL